MYWSYLIHLGYKMWPYWKPEYWKTKTNDKGYEDPRASDPNTLLFDKAVWDEVTGLLADAGCNMLIIDVGEGMRYESHPELAVTGSWSKDELRSEIKRLRDLGITAVPKLNFSSIHDDWLGIYGRMISTPQYYQVVSDVIAEVAEVFGNSGYFHIGMDEERYWEKYVFEYQVQRGLELWWHDLRFIMDEVKKAGCTTMMWADTFWQSKELSAEFIPKDVVLCNWYYKTFPVTSVEQINTYHFLVENALIPKPQLNKWIERLYTFHFLADNDFLQMPTGSTYERTENLPEMVRYCKTLIPNGKWFGFMQTPWRPTISEKLESHREAVVQLEKARKIWESDI